MTINITKRLEWLNKRLGLSEIHKEYIGLQMKELALEVKQKTEQELKSDLLNRVSETLLEKYVKYVSECEGCNFIDTYNPYGSVVKFTKEEIETLERLR